MVNIETHFRNTELFQKFLDCIITPVAYLDKDFNFILVNQAYAKAGNYEPDFFLGKNHFELYPNSENQKEFQRVVDTGEPYRCTAQPFEYTEHLDHNTTYWNWELNLVKNEDNLQVLMLSLIDVTERVIIEDKQSHNLLIQEIVASILQLSLQPMPFKEFMRQALVLALQANNLDLAPRGVIFLLNSESDELEMAVKHDLPDSIVSSCARIRRGECICGQALEQEKLIFTACVDDHHHVTYSGMSSHGHYCIPIKSQEEVLGVLNLYVEHGHKRNRVEEQFITTIADTLASAILRERTSRALKESEKRFRAITETARDAIITINTNGEIISWNRGAELIFGYTHEEIISQPVTKIMPARYQNRHDKAVEQWRTSGKTKHDDSPMEVIGLRKDGTEISVEILLSSWNIEERKHTTGIIRDISKRKQAELLSQHNEKKFKAIIEASPIPLALNDEQGNITYLNKAFVHATGYTSEDIPSLSDWWPLAYPDPKYQQQVINKWQANMQEAKRNHRAFAPMEINIRCKDGSTRIFIASASSLQENFINNHLVVLYDISERKRLELEREQYFKFFQFSIDPMCITDPDGFFKLVNPAFTQLLGFDESELLAKSFLDFILPEDRQKSKDEWQSQSTKRSIISVENRQVCKDGRVILLSWTAHFQKNSDIIYATARDITKSRQAEDALAESHVLLKTIIDTAPVRIFWKDKQLRFLGCNPAFARDAGEASPEDIIGKDDYQLRWKEQAKFYRTDDLQVIDEETVKLSYEETQIRPDGNISWLRTSKVPLRNAANEIIGVLGTYHDITQRKKAELELQIAATAFEANVGIMVTDSQGVIVKINKTFTKHSGYSTEEAIGQTPRLFKSNRHDAAFYAAMWDSINRIGTWEGEIWDRRKNGEIYPKWLSIAAIRGEDGSVSHYVGTQTDITDRKVSENEIKNLAFYDPLTSLPNRRLLQDRLQQALASSVRSKQAGALLFLDLDHFKTINDTLGHFMGDLLLQEVAQRLTDCMREGDTVARLGGDEFVVMLEELGKELFEAATQAEIIAEKILAILNQPYLLNGKEYFNTSSIGITLFKDHEIEIDELFKQADIAMYEAKKAGRNILRFFDPKTQEAINTRVVLEGELRNALERQQLHLHYQIQVDELNRVNGAEALIRWIHPVRGLISPAQFIPLAEESGLIIPIGQWVLEMACLQLETWQKNVQTRDLTLAVNVSAKQFHQVNFVTHVQTIVQQHNIKPDLLKLELTESMLLDNIDKTIVTMNELKAIGVGLSLDDFGTGYSSLQYLKQLPLNQLKIDQSFIRDLAIDDSDKAIVTTIIALAHGLNMEVIAEGVETKEQQQYLLYCGCSHYQGYLFSKAVPIEQFEAFLERDKNT